MVVMHLSYYAQQYLEYIIAPDMMSPHFIYISNIISSYTVV